MLILTRKPGESLYIGDNVKITIVEIKGNQIRVGIDAPSELRIYREEIYLQILEENKKAAAGAHSGSADLDALSGAFSRTKGEGRGNAGKLGSTPHAVMLSSGPNVMVKRKKKNLADEEGDERKLGSLKVNPIDKGGESDE